MVRLPMLGTVATALGALLVGVLHLVPPSVSVDPVRRTISEYALLTNGWVFDLAVLVLAGGSAVVLVALIRLDLVRPVSLGTLGLLLWSVGLTLVVIYPKNRFTADGAIHRAASLIAFIALPVAAIAIGAVWRRHERWRREGWTAVGLGVVSLLCFSPLVWAVLFSEERWWRAIPLGAVERAIALSEVVAVVVLGVWAARASRSAGGPARIPRDISPDLAVTTEGRVGQP
jgi:hypothetical membrane protein